MQATVIRTFGDPDVLKYEELATPKPKPKHILIKVLAAGVNRLDHYIREGSIVPELPFPHILGADAAGEVADLGEGITGFEIGERVIVAPWICAKSRGDQHSSYSDGPKLCPTRFAHFRSLCSVYGSACLRPYQGMKLG